LYSASSDATARAWLKDLGEPLQIYKGHNRSVARLCVHQSVGKNQVLDGFLFKNVVSSLMSELVFVAE
jgi:hypothetical protein